MVTHKLILENTLFIMGAKMKRSLERYKFEDLS